MYNPNNHEEYYHKGIATSCASATNAFARSSSPKPRKQTLLVVVFFPSSSTPSHSDVPTMRGVAQQCNTVNFALANYRVEANYNGPWFETEFAQVTEYYVTLIEKQCRIEMQRCVVISCGAKYNELVSYSKDVKCHYDRAYIYSSHIINSS